MPEEIMRNEAALVLTAMGNARRLEILQLLVAKEMPVTALANILGVSQSSLSQHLAKLRSQKLVSSRRDAQTIYYSCQSPVVLSVLAALRAFYLPQTENSKNDEIHIA